MIPAVSGGSPEGKLLLAFETEEEDVEAEAEEGRDEVGAREADGGD